MGQLMDYMSWGQVDTSGMDPETIVSLHVFTPNNRGAQWLVDGANGNQLDQIDPLNPVD